MMNYLTKKFIEYDCDRVIVNMSLKPTKHLSSGSVIDTWRGLNSYSQYRTTGNHGFQRRFLDCKCDSCVVICRCEDECTCPSCENEEVVGEWSAAWFARPVPGGPGDVRDGAEECFWYDDHCRYNYMSKQQTLTFLKLNKATYAEVDPIEIERAARGAIHHDTDAEAFFQENGSQSGSESENKSE